MANMEPEKGDKVSWSWGGGQPSGEVVETKAEGEIAIESKRGNTIKKNASPSNPAVHVGRSGNDVVKRASELEVDEKASSRKSKSPAPPTAGEGSKKHPIDDEEVDGGEAEASENANDDKMKHKGRPPGKKQKNESATTTKGKAGTSASAAKKETNGQDGKRGRGRPKGGSGAGGTTSSGYKKKKDAKPRATEGIGSRTRSRA